jgi:branched-chain amino acid transport system substrate-binding protein
MNKAAKAAHVAEFGAEPGAFFDAAYAAMQALVNAIDKADSTDADKIMNVLRTENVDTTVGTIKFDERGDAVGVGFSMYQVKGGQYVELK